MVRDTKYCDIMNWLLSCYEPKGRGFESLLARHVAANPCGSSHFSAQNAASPYGLPLLSAKSHARLGCSVASALAYASLSLPTFRG